MVITDIEKAIVERLRKVWGVWRRMCAPTVASWMASLQRYCASCLPSG
jgi:hypothetical protein